MLKDNINDLISFMVVAVLFKMPVSFALGASSLLVLAFGGYNLVTVPQFAVHPEIMGDHGVGRE